ncbi:uncharacterized protein LOC135257800 isoform X2 [Anguilla rostrata]|uniref:uncharacterized protein LOC135257800 isoform X2 n=1 Tax=Anguilla rostrata TaxID=7938 RepID=UPI0030CADFD4
MAEHSMEEMTVANGTSPSYLQKVGPPASSRTDDELQPRPWPRPRPRPDALLSQLHIPPCSAVSLPWPLESRITGGPTSSGSNNEEAEPEAQRHAHLTNQLLQGQEEAETVVSGQGERVGLDHFEAEESHPPKPWAPVRPRTLALKGHALTLGVGVRVEGRTVGGVAAEAMFREGGEMGKAVGRVVIGENRDLGVAKWRREVGVATGGREMGGATGGRKVGGVTCGAAGTEVGGATGGTAGMEVGGAAGGRKVGGAGGQQLLQWGLQRSDSLESLLSRFGLRDGGPKEAGGPVGGLRRADSWESLYSVLHDPQNCSQDTQRSGAVCQTDSDCDLGIYGHSRSTQTPQGCGVSAEDPLSPRYELAMRLLDQARRKTRTGPVQASHALLPEHTCIPIHSTSVARLPEREGPVGVCGYLSDSSSGSSGVSSRRRCGPSPTRVRFQDESEMEAERRYLERQRSDRPPKPHAPPTTRGRSQDGHSSSSSCRRKRSSSQGEALARDRRCSSCETFMRGTSLPRPNPASNRAPLTHPGPVDPHWGTVPPHWVTSGLPGEGQSAGGGGGVVGDSSLGRSRRRRGGKRAERGTGLDLPPELEDLTPQLYSTEQHSPLSLHPTRAPPLAPHGYWPTTVETTGQPNTAGTGISLPLGGGSESQGEEGLWMKSQWEEPCEHARGPDPQQVRPKLSLRRFFSAIGLNSGSWLRPRQACSVERLSSAHQQGSASQTQNPAPSPASGHHIWLRKTPSLQSLGQRPPLIVLRRSSSVQELPIQMKEELSNLYRQDAPPHSPSHGRGLQQTLSVEDVGRPSGVGSLGRVVQVFSDGTLLLELNRPHNGPFGFLISRPNGRADSGVYVERMQGGGKLYVGLLGEGDEILEVNGQKVAELSLEQVTRLMTHNTTAFLRVLSHRRVQR